jgi:hypothetical protein
MIQCVQRGQDLLAFVDLYHGKEPIKHSLAIDLALLMLASSSWLIKSPQLEVIETQAAWCRPQMGVVKINCDGGFSAECMMGSIGVVIRNLIGSFIGIALR